jgi:hypothetical protein
MKVLRVVRGLSVLAGDKGCFPIVVAPTDMNQTAIKKQKHVSLLGIEKRQRYTDFLFPDLRKNRLISYMMSPPRTEQLTVEDSSQQAARFFKYVDPRNQVILKSPNDAK